CRRKPAAWAAGPGETHTSPQDRRAGRRDPQSRRHANWCACASTHRAATRREARVPLIASVQTYPYLSARAAVGISFGLHPSSFILATFPGTPPIEPAPIVITTSPGWTDTRIAV